MITYQKFQTKNDVNGNPRRGWLIGRIAPGQESTISHRNIAWAEEGYEGTAALDRELSRFIEVSRFSSRSLRAYAADLGTVNVTPGEYRAIRKAGLAA